MGNFTSTPNNDRLSMLESRIQYLEQCIEKQAPAKDEGYEHILASKTKQKTISKVNPSWHKELMSKITERRRNLEPAL